MTVQFVADIGANHDGDLSRALRLIRLAAEAGATLVKFQHFRAPHIVSDVGFRALPKLAHQAAWPDAVSEVYAKASIPWTWTKTLARECERSGVEFLSTPYDLEAVEHLNPYVRRWKIGSGDITYRDLLTAVARTRKPILLGTGASTEAEVEAALDVIEAAGLADEWVTLMQCNTNYTGDPDNVQHVNLRWLRYAGGDVGLSDHTRSLPVVLGAVAMGATVIERHFTDDRSRPGPDHGFGMTPPDWRQMVDAVAELEAALGGPEKVVAPNEQEARIVQRRCWRAARDLPAGHVLAPGDVVALRPCPEGGLSPMEDVTGHRLAVGLPAGEMVTRTNIGQEKAA